jgi:hypothetical protein
MSDLLDVPTRYLKLAIENFERAEHADSPALEAKFRELASEYRDKALEMLGRRMQSAPALRRHSSR